MRNKKKVNDKTFVYEINITWNVGAQYPVNIDIKNYYATVNEKPDGTLNVLVASKEAEKRNSMALSATEWTNIIYMMKTNMSMFEQRNAHACYADAARLDRQAREARMAQNQG